MQDTTRKPRLLIKLMHDQTRAKKALAFSLVLYYSGVLPMHAIAADDFTGAAVGIYEEPGAQTNRDFSNTSQVDTVDPFSGALKIVTTDLFIPGNGGLDIQVKRNYNSVTNNTGPYSNGYTARTPYGTGWDINFGRIWVSTTYSYLNQASTNAGCSINQVATNKNPILELPDGSKQILANGDGSDHSFISKDRWIGRCLPTNLNTGSGGLLVYSPEGMKYVFNLKGNVSPDKQNQSYYITKIEDPQGNYLTFTYTAPTTSYTILKSISSSDGRTVNFNYSGETTLSPLLTSISGGGKTVSYGYVDANWSVGQKPQYLTSVTYSDNRKWQYTYNYASTVSGVVPGRFSMATMSSPNNLLTSYLYEYRQMGSNPSESENVISRRTLSNLKGTTTPTQEWNYTYTKGYSPNNDSTLERGPTSCIRYEHVGANSIANGASGVDQGLWKIGLLVKKDIMTLSGNTCGSIIRSDTFTWSSQNISEQNEMRRYNLLVENYTRAPILTRKITTLDGTNYQTDYTYNSYGRPLTIAESGQRTKTTTLSYTRPNNLWMLEKISSQTTSGIPGSISYTYNNSGQTTSENKYGVLTQYQYTSTGDLQSVTDARNYSSTFGDYYRGIARTVLYPDGGTITRQVNANGTIASETDQLGRVTSYTYDSMDRLKSITPPKGASSAINISYSVSANGTTETLSRNNYTRTRNYNQLGQLYYQSEAGGSSSTVIAAIYSANGKPAFISSPSYGSVSTSGESYAYDSLGRLLTQTHADNNRVAYSYLAGNIVRITNERNAVTTKTYSAFGEPTQSKLIGISQPLSINTSIGLDNANRTISIAQGGLTRTYVYNGRGFLDSETNPETGTTSYTYDNAGNLLSKATGGQTNTFTYDPMNRLTGATLGGQVLMSNTFDKKGRLLIQNFPSGSWKFEYDTHDKITKETLELPALTGALATSYSYNSSDALLSITYPSGRTIDYNPNALGLPTKAGQYASSVSYFPNGKVSEVILGNGRTLKTVQHPLTQRTVSKILSGTESPLSQQYSYDAAGNITEINDNQDSSLNQSYTYDDVNRLSSGTGPWGSSSYSYTSTGNISSTNISGYATNYAYDTQGRLNSLTGRLNAIYIYDSRGNALRGRGSYSYDNANRLSSQCTPYREDCSNAPDQTFAYDSRDRLISKISKGVKSYYFYNSSGKLLRVTSPSGYKEFFYLGHEVLASEEHCTDLDSDLDQIPDCYELRFGLNPQDPADAIQDWDNDGATNLDEYVSGSVIRNSDSDGDLMPDGWELSYGLNPTNPADAGLDSNGDGVSNLESYRQGIPPIETWGRTLPAVDFLLRN